MTQLLQFCECDAKHLTPVVNRWEQINQLTVCYIVPEIVDDMCAWATFGHKLHYRQLVSVCFTYTLGISGIGNALYS